MSIVTQTQTLTPEQQAAAIEASWYTPPKPEIPSGWLVFSEEYILRGLRGDVAGRMGKPGPLLYATVKVVQVLMAIAQGLIMLLALTPVINLFLESTAVCFKRGTAGYFLRACYWKAKLRRLGQDTLIDRGVEIWGPRNIEIGARCHIDTYVRLAAGESAFGQKGHIEIGDYAHLSPRVHLAGRGGLKVGDFVELGAGVHIYSASNQFLNPQAPGQLITLSHVAPERFQHVIEAPIEIADYAVVGFNSLLLPGTNLGKGSIVRPYSIITRKYPPFADVAGPGRATQVGWRRPTEIDPRCETGRHPGSAGNSDGR